MNRGWPEPCRRRSAKFDDWNRRGLRARRLDAQPGRHHRGSRWRAGSRSTVSRIAATLDEKIEEHPKARRRRSLHRSRTSFSTQPGRPLGAEGRGHLILVLVAYEIGLGCKWSLVQIQSPRPSKPPNQHDKVVGSGASLSGPGCSRGLGVDTGWTFGLDALTRGGCANAAGDPFAASPGAKLAQR